MSLILGVGIPARGASGTGKGEAKPSSARAPWSIAKGSSDSSEVRSTERPRLSERPEGSNGERRTSQPKEAAPGKESLRAAQGAPSASVSDQERVLSIVDRILEISKQSKRPPAPAPEDLTPELQAWIDPKAGKKSVQQTAPEGEETQAAESEAQSSEEPSRPSNPGHTPYARQAQWEGRRTLNTVHYSA